MSDEPSPVELLGPGLRMIQYPGLEQDTASRATSARSSSKTSPRRAACRGDRLGYASAGCSSDAGCVRRMGGGAASPGFSL